MEITLLPNFIHDIKPATMWQIMLVHYSLSARVGKNGIGGFEVILMKVLEVGGIIVVERTCLL